MLNIEQQTQLHNKAIRVLNAIQECERRIEIHKTCLLSDKYREYWKKE